MRSIGHWHTRFVGELAKLTSTYGGAMENAIGNAIHTVGLFCIGVILFYLADSIRKLKDVLKEYAKGGDE